MPDMGSASDSRRGPSARSIGWSYAGRGLAMLAVNKMARALSALCAVCALPAAAGAPPSYAHMSLLGGPREPLTWSRHDPLTLFSGENLTINKAKPWTEEASVAPPWPGKNQVRYFDCHWRDHDFLEEDGSSGIRFYFYDRE